MTIQPTGFANAVSPVAAQTITTDSHSLCCGEVKIPSTDGEFSAYLACPEKGERFAVILVVQEIFGVHEHIKDICRRLAKLGYLAIAPDLFSRHEDVTLMADIMEILTRVVNKVPDEQVLADIDATVDYVSRHVKGDARQIAITGFCWGGRITWLYCSHNPNIKAGVAWYGKLVGPVSELHPVHPCDIAAQLKVPVLGLYAGNDAGIPLESVEQMQNSLTQSGSSSHIHIYPDVPHAFFADYRPSYRKAEAEDGWKRLQDWLALNGVSTNS
jgi:carboxymethylenebutenolidase